MPPSRTAPEAAAPQDRLDPSKMPRHIAIIMDGNGRWAESKGLPRVAGHKAGVESVRETIRACSDLGIQALTLYAFSTENWLRPVSEVNELMRLLGWVLETEIRELCRNNVRLRVSGRLQGLPPALISRLNEAVRDLSGNTGLILNLALNYGARQEIVDAVNAALASGGRTLDEEAISSHLYTAGLPDPDLLIRTSGEMRVSNFLLWQIAYAEFYVTSVFWPEFRKSHLVEAIAEYQTRRRRFGAV
ncbi:MAG: isoprenyl transferase [Elusimicrobia bacterium]|nr:isoprenyl transferase [Elusimicrobiota bacterium]